MTTVIAVECEWDISLSNKLFSNSDVAYAHTKIALAQCGIEESIDELMDEGLVSFRTMQIKTDMPK